MRKLFVLSVAAWCVTLYTFAEILPAEKALPDDTLVMVTVPDFNKMRDVLQNSPQGKLWNDPAMKDFKDKLISKVTGDFTGPLEHDLGVHFEDYTNLPQGQVTFAVVQDGWEAQGGKLPALLLLIDTKDKSAQLKTSLADLKKKWVDAGKTVKTETIRDVEFSAISLSPSDIPKSLKKPLATLPNGTTVDAMEDPEAKKAPPKLLYIGQAESLLIMGNSPKVIEKVLARMSGASVKTVGDVAGYQANAGMFHDVPIYGWVNAKAVVDIFAKPNSDSADPDAASPFAFKPDKIMAAAGLTGLKTVAFNYNWSNEGALFNLMLGVPESDRRGLFKIMAGEAKDYNPPPFVPVDAIKFQRWRVDGQKTWATVRKMLADISPSWVGGVDFLLTSAEAVAKDKDPGFDINKALFGNLGDDIITYEKAPKEGAGARSITLIASPNPEQLASALKTLLVLYAQSPAEPTSREFLGHKIYSIPMPAMPGDTSTKASPRGLNYTSGNGYVAITLDNGILEEFLRSSETPPKALRDTPGLSDAAQKVTGAGASLFGYTDQTQSMRSLFDALKKNPASANDIAGLGPIALATGATGLKVEDWMDVSLLPSFDKIAKYFHYSVYGSSASAEGLSFKAFAPTPPEMNK